MTGVYVINLDRSKDRWSNVLARAGQAGVSVNRVSGIDGRHDVHPIFLKYDDRQSVRRKGCSLNAGQLGCFASHYQLWEACVEGGAPIFVLEDDVQLYQENFRYFIDEAPDLPAEFECVRLFRNKSRKPHGIRVMRCGHFDICKYLKGHMSTTGYYLTPGGAQKLIAHSERWWLPVDLYMDQFWHHGVECYGVEPPCVTNDKRFESTIVEAASPTKSSKSLRTRIVREVYAASSVARRGIHNLLFRLRRLLASVGWQH